MKLKNLKGALKSWKKTCFGSTTTRIKCLREKLAQVHQSLQLNPCDGDAERKESLIQGELNHWLANKEEEIRQRSRESWLHLGDKNTKFFFTQ